MLAVAALTTDVPAGSAAHLWLGASAGAFLGMPAVLSLGAPGWAVVHRSLAGPQPAPADATPPAGATIAGTWTAQPAPNTSITLTTEPGGAFTWKVTQDGKSRQFSGTSTYGGGILTLAQSQGPAMVGRIGWKDTTHMTFHVVGEGPDSPGLAFSR